MEENDTPAVVEETNNTLGTVGLVSGILSVIFVFCCGYLSIVLGIIALVCGILAQQRQQQYGLAGIVLGAIGIVLGIIFFAASFIVLPFLFEILEAFLYW